MFERYLHPYRIVTVGVIACDDPPPPTPGDPEEQLARARYEADTARADAAKIKKQLDEIQRQLPSDEQRAKWAELEAQHQTAEETRRRKEGEFDAWRQQIQATHAKELDAIRQETQNNAARADATERELNDTLIGLAFSGATEWFGVTGKTIMLPDMARSYFSGHVSVEVVPPLNGTGPSTRRVVVKDVHGTVIVDSKSGKPMSFAQAIGEVIDSHPQKAYLLRGSGKVGSGSAGGDHPLEGRDLTKLKAADFRDPKVREAVRESLTAPGGLQIGPGFDAIERGKRKS